MVNVPCVIRLYVPSARFWAPASITADVPYRPAAKPNFCILLSVSDIAFELTDFATSPVMVCDSVLRAAASTWPPTFFARSFAMFSETWCTARSVDQCLSREFAQVLPTFRAASPSSPLNPYLANAFPTLSTKLSETSFPVPLSRFFTSSPSTPPRMLPSVCASPLFAPVLPASVSRWWPICSPSHFAPSLPTILPSFFPSAPPIGLKTPPNTPCRAPNPSALLVASQSQSLRFPCPFWIS